jgi:hypothetical protein
MSYAEQMLRSSPNNPPVDEAALAVLAECIEACFDCAQTCTACADACMAEKNFQELMRCIRLNLHCADVCATTGRILSRQEAPELARAVVEACALACRLCGDECEKHGAHMAHCRVCAEACRRCEDACNRLLAALEPPKLPYVTA